MSHESPSDFSPLDRCRYLALTTFRRDGQPIVTSVAFVRDSNRLYVAVPPDAELIGRIHENAQVEVAPCDAEDGSAIEAMAVVLPHDRTADARRAFAALGGRRRLLALFTRRVYLEITRM